jgi:hypothetical protein
VLSWDMAIMSFLFADVPCDGIRVQIEALVLRVT